MYNFSKNKNIILLLAITLIMIFCDSSLAKKTKKIIKLDPAEFNTNFKNYNQKIIIVNNYNQNIAEFMVAIADSRICFFPKEREATFRATAAALTR